MYLLYCPCPNLESASKLAKTLVDQKMAFCCNILSNVTSIFFWQDKLQEDNETVLLAKTLNDEPEKIVKYLEGIHPYEEPVIIYWSALKN